MIGLLDPALFLQRSDQSVEEDFDFVLGTCRRFSIDIPPFKEYWDAMWSEMGFPLENALGTAAKQAMREVRKLGSRTLDSAWAQGEFDARVWKLGFEQLFGASQLPSPWVERMTIAAVRALTTNQETVLIVRRVVGRNLHRHASGHVVLDENTRWVLHLQPRGIGHRRILCVHHPRNLEERWTSRYDWRLPSAGDGSRYPFCPPDAWWNISTPAFGTVRSKPAWLDRHGNGWARPNIPGGAGYHWDVFIGQPALQQSVGLDQINVVEFGSAEGRVGQIHHIPEDKRGRFTGNGWVC